MIVGFISTPLMKFLVYKTVHFSICEQLCAIAKAESSSLQRQRKNFAVHVIPNFFGDVSNAASISSISISKCHKHVLLLSRSNLLPETILRNCFSSLEYQETLFQQAFPQSLQEFKVACHIKVVYATVHALHNRTQLMVSQLRLKRGNKLESRLEIAYNTSALIDRIMALHKMIKAPAAANMTQTRS